MARPRSGCAESDVPYPDTAMTVRELPAEMRPREEFLRRGASNVSDDVLLAILLRSGTAGKNVIDLARDLLRTCGGLGAIARASHEEILARRIQGLGPVKAMELAAALELGRRAAGLQPAAEPPAVRDPAAAARVIHPLTHALQQEVFWTLLLDTKNRLIGQPIEASRGLLDASPVHPREVFSRAIRHGAAAVILAHNHPSGDPTPSAEDLRVTRQLIEASRVLGIRVLDHIIVGRPSDIQPGYLSLRDKGLVSFDGV
jgi:DNA repair protein RadC